MSHHDPSLAAHTANPQADAPVWYALRPEARSAALNLSELRALALRQQLRSDDLVWRHGWDRWYPAHLVHGLFPAPTGGAAPAVPDRGTHEHSPPQNLLERGKHELRSYLIVTGYIWAVLTLLRLHEHVLSGTYGFNITNEGWAIVTALILGKVVLIAEMLHAGRSLSQRFPSLTVIIKSCAVALALLIFHVLEHLAMAWWNAEDILHVVGGGDGTFWLSLIKTAMMAVAFMPYFMIKQVEESTGQTDLLLLSIGLKR